MFCQSITQKVLVWKKLNNISNGYRLVIVKLTRSQVDFLRTTRFVAPFSILIWPRSISLIRCEIKLNVSILILLWCPFELAPGCHVFTFCSLVTVSFVRGRVLVYMISSFFMDSVIVIILFFVWFFMFRILVVYSYYTCVMYCRIKWQTLIYLWTKMSTDFAPGFRTVLISP